MPGVPHDIEIHAHLLKAGMSMRDLAERTRIGLPVLARYAAHEDSPRMGQLWVISNALGVSMRDLILFP